MRKSSRIGGLLAVLAVLATAAAGAVRGKACLYLAGTVPGFEENTPGQLQLDSETAMVFVSDKGQRFEVAWDHINSLEYGEKAGRRLAIALVVSPWVLFSKKRRHFLTLGYTDAQGKPQGMLLEIAKNEVAGAIVVIEARSGHKVEYESLEAEAHVHG